MSIRWFFKESLSGLILQYYSPDHLNLLLDLYHQVNPLIHSGITFSQYIFPLTSVALLPIMFPPERIFDLMKVRDILNRIHLISAILASLFLAFLLVIISTNVIMRYFFASGISWMEEISSNVLMTAFTFLSMAIGVKLDSHINVNLFPKGTPQWVTTVLLKLKHLVLTVIGFVLCYYGILLIMGIKGSIASIPSLPASLQFIVIPLAGFLILCDSVMNLLGVEKDDHYLDRTFMGVGEKK